MDSKTTSKRPVVTLTTLIVVTSEKTEQFPLEPEKMS